MKNRKLKVINKFYFIGALLFVLCSLLFLSGCSDTFDTFAISSSDKKPQTETPAPGTGYFILKIDGIAKGRTIQPVIEPDKYVYNLYFFNSSMEGPVFDDISFDYQTDGIFVTGIIELPIGKWDLYVEAYLNEDMQVEARPIAVGSLQGIDITENETLERELKLAAGMNGNNAPKGWFVWDITYPDAGTIYGIITQLDGTITESFQINNNSIELDTGFYRLIIEMTTADGRFYVYRDVIHIYTNLESIFVREFGDHLFPEGVRFVTNGNDDGYGSLRQVIQDAPAGSTIIINSGVREIDLRSAITIDKNIVIEGNGVTIKQSTNFLNAFLFINDNPDVTIKRIHFTGGSRRAIYIQNGNVIIESSIFSYNSSGSAGNGGAIFNGGNLVVNGCTFYMNTGDLGGVFESPGELYLSGNLFFRNTANYNNDIAYGSSSNIVSGGYNITDVPIGPDNFLSGWEAGDGDTTFDDFGNFLSAPFNTETFAPSDLLTLDGLDLGGVDFYGAIRTPGVPGAVVSTAVTFDFVLNFGNGETIEGLAVAGNLIIEPHAGEKEMQEGLFAESDIDLSELYYESKGWFIDDTKWDFETPIDSDGIEITAKWESSYEFIDLSNTAGNTIIEKAVSYINSAADGDYTLFLQGGSQPINARPMTFTSSVNRKELTIKTLTSDVTIQLSETGSLFTIPNNVTLTLDSYIVLQGMSDNNSSLVTVNGGAFYMRDYSIIRGNTALYGGGVYVSDNGTFTMNGGSIFNNFAASLGGGVHVYHTGTFYMRGGEIYGNRADNGGGGVFVEVDGTFIKAPVIGNSSGVIYGVEIDGYNNGIPLINEAYGNGGNAVFVSGTPAKKRNTTVEENETLDSSTDDGWLDPFGFNINFWKNIDGNILNNTEGINFPIQIDDIQVFSVNTTGIPSIDVNSIVWTVVMDIVGTGETLSINPALYTPGVVYRLAVSFYMGEYPYYVSAEIQFTVIN